MAEASVASMIDHTILKPEATAADVHQLCLEASECGVAAICVSPSQLPLGAGWLPPSIGIATVVGFPSGAHRPETKASEAVLAVEHGATEIDMVVDLGQVKSGAWTDVEAGIALLRRVVESSILVKVIIESAALTDDEIVRACQVAEAAGADFVKTSTGFHPAGGASISAVRLMADTVGGRLGVKASGGVRTTEAALAMVAAGATRLGTSSTLAIVSGQG